MAQIVWAAAGTAITLAVGWTLLIKENVSVALIALYAGMVVAAALTLMEMAYLIDTLVKVSKAGGGTISPIVPEDVPHTDAPTQAQTPPPQGEIGVGSTLTRIVASVAVFAIGIVPTSCLMWLMWNDDVMTVSGAFLVCISSMSWLYRVLDGLLESLKRRSYEAGLHTGAARRGAYEV